MPRLVSEENWTFFGIGRYTPNPHMTNQRLGFSGAAIRSGLIRKIGPVVEGCDLCCQLRR